jgi:hypothetical protein
MLTIRYRPQGGVGDVPHQVCFRVPYRCSSYGRKNTPASETRPFQNNLGVFTGSFNFSYTLTGGFVNTMVSVARARALALSMPEAEEKSHFNHPDFRVCNKIFAALWPQDLQSVVKLDPGERARLVLERPKVFSVSPYGKRGGYTVVDLVQIEEDELRVLMMKAWRGTAPKRLVAEHDAGLGSALPAPPARARRDKDRKP